jgi:retron-type reverse transcriptase
MVLKRWWVVDADIQGYFTIDHELLMRLLQRRVSDHPRAD